MPRVSLSKWMGFVAFAALLSTSSALAWTGAGTAVRAAGVDNVGATFWDLATTVVLPLLGFGVLAGGVGGALPAGGASRSIAYGTAAGAVGLAILAAFIPQAVTTLMTGAGTAASPLTGVTLPVLRSGPGVLRGILSDPTVVVAIALVLTGLSRARRVRHA